jgi:hypothetical protein
VFDNHIIIFSDKSCEFTNSGNLIVDWSRWYKKAILKSADQVFGAERWLRDFPDHVFLDRGCTHRFPLEIPAIADARIHRVVVCHGAEARCREVLGGSGSLMIRPEIVGPAHYDHVHHHVEPFAVGNIDPAKGYVHVLDDASLDLVMEEIDTITDFVTYLSDKEQLIRDGSLESAFGEEDLLAHYLFPLENRDKNSFLVPRNDRLRVEGGLWNRFERDQFRAARREANKISYLWDEIIQTSAENSLAGTLAYASHPGVAAGVRTLRLLARESRTRRRLLAKSFRDFVVTAPQAPNVRGNRWSPSTAPGDPYYAFLTLSPESNGNDHQKYREARRLLLNVSLEALKIQYPEAVEIAGIATEPGNRQTRSYDIASFDDAAWTEEELREARARVESLGFFKNVTVSSGTEYDYPHPASRPQPSPFQWRKREVKGRHRNQPCPCGSGKKFKHCCGP